MVVHLYADIIHSLKLVFHRCLYVSRDNSLAKTRGSTMVNLVFIEVFDDHIYHNFCMAICRVLRSLSGSLLFVSGPCLRYMHCQGEIHQVCHLAIV